MNGLIFEMEIWATHRIKNDTVEIETTHTPDVDQWSYVTAQVDRLSEEIKIFKNGSLIHSESFVSSEASPLIGENWSIGTGNLAYVIDETRLSSTARSVDWIKACFDNQKVNPDFLFQVLNLQNIVLPPFPNLSYLQSSPLFTTQRQLEVRPLLSHRFTSGTCP